MPDFRSTVSLQSTITADGELRLGLAEMPIPDPGPDEVIVQVEATPINPSDLVLLLGPVDPADLESLGSDERPELRARVPASAMTGLRARIGHALTPGNEGAGLVVAAGGDAGAWLGRRVGMCGGSMYTRYRRLSVEGCIALPEGLPSVAGAAMFINPLTALMFVDTMRVEGHRAIIHYAAASNLGRMLNRLCLAERIPLINVVRSDTQATLLTAEGAIRVLDSSRPGFENELKSEIDETGATLCFDPIGGGRTATTVLAAMEASAAKRLTSFDRYGTDVFKQVYIYGLLDRAPTVLDQWVGFAWAVGGWLLPHRLARAGSAHVAGLRQRVVDGLTTTFASDYTCSLTLREALSLQSARAYGRKATGQKFLITPHEGAS